MSVINTPNCSLYYEEQGVGQPILLMHPAGGTASTWGAVVDELSRVGRVIAYDRRGYGRSTGGVARSASVHTADAVAVLEVLHATSAVAIGVSAGATLALDLAVRRPDLVSLVVAHESPWRAMRHPTAAGLGTLARVEWLARRGRYGEAAAVLLRWVYAYREGGSAWDAFPAEWRRITKQSGRSVVADLRNTMGSYPHRADLATITSRVVCSHGARSLDYMRSITLALAEAIPTATVRVIQGAAHAVAFDAPDEFVRVAVDAIRLAQREPEVDRRGSIVL